MQSLMDWLILYQILGKSKEKFATDFTDFHRLFDADCAEGAEF
jgi:hypothetical protein